VPKDAADLAKSLYEQAQAHIKFDQATIERRQAELEAAQVNLDYTNIISTVKGTVVSRNVTIGQTVAASFQTPTLFLIAADLTPCRSTPMQAKVTSAALGKETTRRLWLMPIPSEHSMAVGPVNTLDLPIHKRRA
jgi:multidrug efflux pump subunit AcrA (membrane-fusion protein)